MKRVALSLLLALASSLVLTGSVLAHANLVRSSPPAGAVLEQSPQEVRLWFSEPLEPGFSRIQVLDRTGAQVTAEDNRIDPSDPKVMVLPLKPLDPGVYTVSWRALSQADGHVTRGFFTFSVGTLLPGEQGQQVAAGATQAAVPPVEPVLRWLTFLALAALAGGFAFGLLLRGLETQRRRRAEGQSALSPGKMKALRVFIWAAVLLAAASIGYLFLHAASLAEGPPTLAAIGTALGSRWGLLWLARMGLLVGMAMPLVAVTRDRGAWPWWAGLGAAILLLLTVTLNSHAAATGEAFTIAMDSLHLVAAALWLGGLFHLVLALFPALWGAQQEARGALLRALVPRFSALAVPCVAVLILTGLYSWWVQVGVLLPALDTAYGQALLAKLLLIPLMLALGALNLLWVRPRAAQPSVQAHFRTFVRAEAIPGRPGAPGRGGAHHAAASAPGARIPPKPHPAPSPDRRGYHHPASWARPRGVEYLRGGAP
ncbi:MAG: copper resistance protein CopC/CopD [Chloroflexi bacterium]|nr:copper resistance protein CopC/CopD [Chloroflexota bacterium]